MLHYTCNLIHIYIIIYNIIVASITIIIITTIIIIICVGCVGLHWIK